MPMKKYEYLTDIEDATEAARLHRLGQQAGIDPELSPRELAQVLAAIGQRFCRLNFLAAKPNAKGRW